MKTWDEDAQVVEDSYQIGLTKLWTSIECKLFFICSAWFHVHLYPMDKGAWYKCLKLLYIVPWLSFYFLQKVSGQKKYSKHYKDFIIASRLIVHIHAKMKLDSKLKKRGSHKFANILFYFRETVLLFWNIFFSNFYYSPNFRLSTTHTWLR
jgi:hypothetical protein